VKEYDVLPPVQRDEIVDGPHNQMQRLLDTLARLRSEKRRRLLEVLDRSPGLNIDELAQTLGVRRTAAIHHLRRLEKQITIVRVRQGRHVLHFLGSLPPSRRAAICLARVPSIQRIIQDLAQNPQYSQEDVATRVGVSRRTVRRAIRRLSEFRLIDLQPALERRGIVVRLGLELASSTGLLHKFPGAQPVAPAPVAGSTAAGLQSVVPNLRPSVA
jgi:DNA-binding MarR family transcriptional regulator